MEYQKVQFWVRCYSLYIYTNDLNKVIQHSVMHHFTDDTNLLYSSNSLKQIKRYMNHDLKLIVHWFQANRISLNVDKTKIVIFRPKRKQIANKKYEHLNKRPKDNTQNTNQICILGLVLNEHLTWSAKLNINMHFLLHIFHMALKYGDKQKIK